MTVTKGQHPAIDRSILEHELVHKRQIAEYQQAWQPGKDLGDDSEEGWVHHANDPRNAGGIEVEDYDVTIGVVEDWLRQHCPGFGI